MSILTNGVLFYRILTTLIPRSLMQSVLLIYPDLGDQEWNQKWSFVGEGMSSDVIVSYTARIDFYNK